MFSRYLGRRGVATVRNYIDGQFTASKATQFIEGLCPVT